MIRRVQALSGFIGRKEYRRRYSKWLVKSFGSTKELLVILLNLSNFGKAGIFGVGVKSVDIEKNTKGEGRPLGIY